MWAEEECHAPGVDVEALHAHEDRAQTPLGLDESAGNGRQQSLNEKVPRFLSPANAVDPDPLRSKASPCRSQHGRLASSP
jgi:hypothetical protein